jgi:cation diffusion facilitator CzcD-associated flavoprotein CzcO
MKFFRRELGSKSKTTTTNDAAVPAGSELHAQSQSQKSGTKEKYTVVVIGAGVSGLAAAKYIQHAFTSYQQQQQQKQGKCDGDTMPSVVVLEARDRIGGRTYTYIDNNNNIKKMDSQWRYWPIL